MGADDGRPATNAELASTGLGASPVERDPLLGTMVAERYRVRRMLGEGGMGVVYEAFHEAIEKRIALKVLREEYSRKEDIVTRFQQEAISASRIKHPNVLDVFDFGRLPNGCFFLAMEFLEGHDLAQELERSLVLAPARAVGITLQVCRALAAAHARGVVHRDMKPENIFIQKTADGEEIVKIVDFGIAQLRTGDEGNEAEPKRRRLTRTGMIFGTPEYMSPEQAQGRATDSRVDVYAVGVIMYEMLTGAVPFRGDTFMAVLAAHLQQEAPNMREIYPDLAASPELEGIVRRTLVKDPNQRYQTMQDLAASLAHTPEARFIATVGLPGMSAATPALSAGLSGNYTAAPIGSPTHPTPVPLAGPGTPQPSLAPTQRGGAATPMTPEPFMTSNAGIADGRVTNPPPPPRAGTSLGVVALIVALTAIAAGVGVMLFVRPTASEGGAAAPTTAATPATAPVASASSAPPSSATTSSATAPLPEASAPPSASAPPASDKVMLTVETQPTGAEVFLGDAQVCPKSPCSFPVKRDETLDLSAVQGRLRGKKKILALADQTVTITLAAPAGPAPTGPRMCEYVDAGTGLKLMRPCQ